MKKHAKLYLLALSLWFVASCKKDVEPLLFWGESTALLNAVEWEAKPIISILHGHYSLYCQVFNSKGDITQGLSFRYIPPRVGKYVIEKTDPGGTSGEPSAFFLTFEGGDAIKGVYDVVPNNGKSYIEITSIDGDVVEGNYELDLYLEEDRKLRHPDLPPWSRFAYGRFKTKVLRNDDK